MSSSLSAAAGLYLLYPGATLRGPTPSSADACVAGKLIFHHFECKTSFLGTFTAGKSLLKFGLKNTSGRASFRGHIKCRKVDDFSEEVTVERPPYYSYMDSITGKLEPASGARPSIPDQEYWPEGTISQVRAARAPEPTGKSEGAPSYGKNPGSRRKKYKTAIAAAKSSDMSVDPSDPITPETSDPIATKTTDPVAPETSNEILEDSTEFSSEYVTYQEGPEKEELTQYELDKRRGAPHPFIDPNAKKQMEEPPLTSEGLWWNWREFNEEHWSRWQRQKGSVETVFLKAMAETGQIKLYGEHPTVTETALYRARRKVFKEERLQAEKERLESTGPLAYYSEWVKAWKRDTSREAIQKHFEETGENENAQLIEMFQHQTAEEYRIMMGTDRRIQRDPLAMRMREDQIKQIWGGDPVYPTINYIQDPNETIDYRGPDFHEPTPDMLAFLKEHGKIITREEIDKILAEEKAEKVENTDMDEAMEQAVDIGENDDEEDNSEAEADDEAEEKITREWSLFKSSPHLRKNKDKPKKKDSMSLQDAIEDSENITDFLMDFDEEE